MAMLCGAEAAKASLVNVAAGSIVPRTAELAYRTLHHHVVYRQAELCFGVHRHGAESGTGSVPRK